MPIPLPREDDLFRQSTMSFGQHIAELRVCLFKSLVALAVGFGVGLLVGEYVVNFIQRPLAQALKRYYQKETLTLVGGELQKLEQSGAPSPWTLEDLKQRVANEDYLVDERYVDPTELLQQLKSAFPEQLKDVPLPAPPPQVEGADKAAAPKMLRLFLWHHSKDDPRLRSKSLGTTESFSVYVKASLLVGALLASPWVFYYIWSFVAAGLYPHERRYVQLYGPFSLGLFLVGAALAFFIVFDPVLDFLLKFNRSLGIDPEPRIKEWLGFVLVLPIGFGLGFQLPLVMLFLERIGVFNVANYLAQWRIAVLVIFVAAAIFTPPDPISMLLLGFSLMFLYFGGVMLCKLMPHRGS